MNIKKVETKPMIKYILFTLASLSLSPTTLMAEDIVPIHWVTSINYRKSVVENINLAGKVVLVNATNEARTYGGHLTSEAGSFERLERVELPINPITLQAKTMCFLDQSIIKDTREAESVVYTPLYVLPTRGQSRSLIYDITDPTDPIFNGAFQTSRNNVTTCSRGENSICASGKWGSWSVGLANLENRYLPSDTTVDDHFFSKSVKTLTSNKWGGKEKTDGHIYYRGIWKRRSVALLLIQGTTDGQGFDSFKSAPNANEIEAAPPCSNFRKL